MLCFIVVLIILYYSRSLNEGLEVDPEPTSSTELNKLMFTLAEKTLKSQHKINLKIGITELNLKYNTDI